MVDGSVRATLVASLTTAPRHGDVEGLAGRVDVLEVRADLTGEIEPGWLRERFPGRLVYTLRSVGEGGVSEELGAERHARLRRAARGYDLVDLEAERDLEPPILDEVGVERRLVSWHGDAVETAALERILDRMLDVEAVLYKLVPTVSRAASGLAPLELLRRRPRDDLVAFAGGEAGVWTRPIAPRLGSPWVFGGLGGPPAAPGQPTIERLGADYGLPELPPAKRLFGVAGNPAVHSLSPRLHNGLYRQLGVEALYVPFQVEEFGRFWLDLVEAEATAPLGLPLEGLSVTAPHKRVALAVAGATSPLAERIGAANTLVRRRRVWEAEATDPEGVLGPLRERGVRPVGARAAVLGAGGAGRSAVVALQLAGARVELFNRTPERALAAGRRLGVPSAALSELEAGRFDLLVNATPLGRRDEPPPFDPSHLASDAVVVDMVYRSEGATPLVASARRRGLTAIDGREVLLHQAALQFLMMTGRELPIEEGRRLLR